MRQIRIHRPRARREHRWHEVLPPDPRDPDVVRAKALATKPVHSAGAGTPAARRSPLGWIPGWPRPGQRRLPAETTGLVALRDGSTVLIRQVHSTDAPLLADGFARLSSRSRQLRFLTRKKLSPAELRYFTDVDHRDHEALAALTHPGGHGEGIARYIRHADDPHAAEIAVTIVDDWQGRGLGTELLTRLTACARSGGIHRFTALVAEDNTAVIRMLRTMGASLAGRSPGTVEYEITLVPQRRAQPHQPWARTPPNAA